MISLNPVTIKKIKRFRAVKRGFWSFVILFVMIFISFFAEAFINSRALLVYYNGSLYFPTYTDMIPGSTFNLGYKYETNYRDLKKKFQKDKSSNFVIMPPVPYNPYENDLKINLYPPFPPSFKENIFLEPIMWAGISLRAWYTGSGPLLFFPLSSLF